MALLANIKQLFVPHKANGNGKDPVTFRDYGDDMRVIETWAMQLVASLGAGITHITSVDGTVTVTNPFGPTTDLHAAGGSGGYASLTGPGQGATPGALTQAGAFTVTPGVFNAGNVSITGTSISGLRIEGPNNPSSNLSIFGYNLDIAAGGSITLESGTAGGSNDINIGTNNVFSTTNVRITCSMSGGHIYLTGGVIHISEVGGQISFFGHTPTYTQATINGSRGGNVALANLLTALATSGLIVDNTTP